MPGFYPKILCCWGHTSTLSSNKGQVSSVTAHSDCQSEGIIALIGILLREECLVCVMDLIAIWSLETTAWSICYILLDFWKVRSDFLQA